LHRRPIPLAFFALFLPAADSMYHSRRATTGARQFGVNRPDNNRRKANNDDNAFIS
jgi:hypothetical protein